MEFSNNPGMCKTDPLFFLKNAINQSQKLDVPDPEQEEKEVWYSLNSVLALLG